MSNCTYGSGISQVLTNIVQARRWRLRALVCHLSVPLLWLSGQAATQSGLRGTDLAEISETARFLLCDCKRDREGCGAAQSDTDMRKSVRVAEKALNSLASKRPCVIEEAEPCPAVLNLVWGLAACAHKDSRILPILFRLSAQSQDSRLTLELDDALGQLLVDSLASEGSSGLDSFLGLVGRDVRLWPKGIQIARTAFRAMLQPFPREDSQTDGTVAFALAILNPHSYASKNGPGPEFLRSLKRALNEDLLASLGDRAFSKRAGGLLLDSSNPKPTLSRLATALLSESSDLGSSAGEPAPTLPEPSGIEFEWLEKAGDWLNQSRWEKTDRSSFQNHLDESDPRALLILALLERVGPPNGPEPGSADLGQLESTRPRQRVLTDLLWYALEVRDQALVSKAVASVETIYAQDKVGRERIFSATLTRAIEANRWEVARTLAATLNTEDRHAELQRALLHGVAAGMTPETWGPAIRLFLDWVATTGDHRLDAIATPGENQVAARAALQALVAILKPDWLDTPRRSDGILVEEWTRAKKTALEALAAAYAVCARASNQTPAMDSALHLLFVEALRRAIASPDLADSDFECLAKKLDDPFAQRREDSQRELLSEAWLMAGPLLDRLETAKTLDIVSLPNQEEPWLKKLLSSLFTNLSPGQPPPTDLRQWRAWWKTESWNPRY